LITLRALFNGTSFMDCNKEFNSAIMAGC